MRSQIESLLTGKAGETYQSLLDELNYSTPHQFVDNVEKLFQQGKYGRNVHGTVFEYSICECLAQEGIVPFYFQASFEFVPNAIFDIVLYKLDEPVVLSLKTEMRERWKQAALEGMFLRQVHRKASSYLLTLHPKEQLNLARKIQHEEIVGLTDCIRPNLPDFDEFLQKMKQIEWEQSQPVDPITSTKPVQTT